MVDKPLSNREIVTLAVYLLSGEAQGVDTEDVAVKANEIARGRFSWRKYPEQINLELVRVYLSDAKVKGNYLLGSGSTGWILTPKGLDFARSQVERLAGADLGRQPLSPKERRWRQAERIRLLSDEAFRKCRSGQADWVAPQEAEAVFRVDDYVRGKAREERLARMLNAFGDDPELGVTLRILAAKVPPG